MSDLRVRPSRVVISVVAMAAAVAAAVWLSDEAYSAEWLYQAQRGLRDDGFGIIACYAAGIVLGTALHSLLSLRRGRALAAAWGAAGLLLAYGAAVTGVAWLLAEVAPAMSASRHRHDPGALYTTWLVCVLLPVAGAVCAGGLFPRRRTPQPAGRPEPDGPVAVLKSSMVVVSASIGWAIGGIVLILLLIAIVIRLFV
ncbi:hypothetical protein QEZ54_19130 [Catellatospora sp. KI3]|uniref:hypothetical protein n=1 Tax=Catellatospora sp. KI3 TaxID=3041620 RepID=UPI002482746B|nr:hypothetical protein [Catellatospora sp. KI3]MDI1463095.1 hypothetical protein [Catellatospora sp. KI3]